jgi:hypothetical protein
MQGDWLFDWLAWTPGWFYALIFVAVLVWYLKNSGLRSRGPSGTTMIEICEQQLLEMRRTNAALEKMVAALEMRSPR